MKKNLTAEQYEALTYSAAGKYNKSDYETALDMFLRLEDNNWENPKVHEVLSNIYLKLENIEKSREEFHIYMDLLKRDDPSISLPRTFEELVEDAGDLKNKQSQYDKIMKRKTQKEPFKDFDVPAKLSILYMSIGDYKKAEKVLVSYKEKFVDKVIVSKNN